MLKTFIFTLLFTLAVGLSAQLNDVAQGWYDSLEGKPVVNEFTPAMRDSIIKFLQGEWLYKPYYEELVRTKSPLKASEINVPLTTLRFFANEEDKNAFGMYGLEAFHCSEVEKFILEKSDAQQFQFKTAVGNRVLRIPSLQNECIQLEFGGDPQAYQYVKCDPLYEQVNKLLVVGTYTTEFDGKATTVKFNADNMVEGLGELGYYFIHLDIFFQTIDTISLGNENDSSPYAFEIKDDAIVFYETKVDESGFFLQKDKLFCRLTKVR